MISTTWSILRPVRKYTYVYIHTFPNIIQKVSHSVVVWTNNNDDEEIAFLRYFLKRSINCCPNKCSTLVNMAGKVWLQHLCTAIKSSNKLPLEFLKFIILETSSAYHFYIINSTSISTNIIRQCKIYLESIMYYRNKVLCNKKEM